VPNVVCPHCRENVVVPEDLAQAHCVRCGGVLSVETNITAHAPGLLPDAYVEREPANLQIELPERYTDWEEFRSLSPAIQRELMHMAARPLPDLRAIMPAPVPDDAPDLVTQWGRPLGTLDLSHGIFQHWIILGIMLLGIGMFMHVGAAMVLVQAHNDPAGKIGRRSDKNTAPGYLFLFGFGFFSVVGGLYCLAVRGRQKPTAIWLFEDGLLLQQRNGFQTFHWDEILDFEVVKRRGQPIYWLRFTEQFSVKITIGTDFEIMPLMEYMEIRLSSSQFLHRLRQIFNGQREPFGVLTFDKDGIGGPRFFAPWSEVRRVITDANRVFIDWTRRTDWVPIPYEEVSFPCLVVALAAVLVDEHKRLTAAQ
jgi:hypothetical protein